MQICQGEDFVYTKYPNRFDKFRATSPYQQLIGLRYDDELSMEEIGKLQNVSKMAISKRLKKLHQKLRGSVT